MPDSAMATWTGFLNYADGVCSVQVRAAIQDMRVRLCRFPNVPEVRELTSRAAALAQGRLIR
ncbi:hypothetical protein [Streptomyces hokutonensis]|uniref:Uncharacterized protein n=1 Tax=Streptomyces hokutonensis TaxID=1306990 RepID=A0ABW6M762_9ACTN